MYEETYVFYLFFLYTRVHQASPEFILTLTDTLTSYQVTTTREQSKKKRGNARKRVWRVSWRKILTNLIRSMLWQPELITRFFQVWRIGNVVNNPHSDGNSFQIICGGVDCARTIRRQLWSSKTWSGQWLTTTQHEVPLWFLYYQYKLCYHQCQ